MAVLTAGPGLTRPSREQHRSAAIYGIRGFAAVALLTVHVGMFSGLLGTRALGTPRPPSNFLGAFLVTGLPAFIGVFFVLPALFLYLPFAKAVIAGAARPAQATGLARRLVRLLPGYSVMCLVALFALNRNAIDGIWYVLRPLLLLQVYTPNPFVPRLMNGMEITWTVPSMVQWYLVLPLIGLATHRYAARGATPAARARRLMLPVPVLIGLGVGWLFFVKAMGWDNRIVFWWPQGFAPTIGIGMALAILLALAQVSPPDTPRLLRVAAAHPMRFWAAALAVYVVNCARPFSVIGMDAIYSVSGLFVTYVMVGLFGFLSAVPLVAPGARVGLVERVLSARPVVHIGRVSYGVYLWHFAVMHVFLQPGTILSGQTRPIRELYAASGFWQLETVTLVGAVLLATLSYRLVEQPVAAWFERYLDRRRDRAVLAGPPVRRPIAPGPRAAPAAPGPDATGPVPAGRDGPVLTPAEATAALAAASADRAAIQANLVDLERQFGRQLLAGAELTGRSKQRWVAASADLGTLWEIFNAYSAVLDEANRACTGRPSTVDLVRLTGLLTGASVVVTRAPAPLAVRHITDSGQTCLTVGAAVQQMHERFARTAELVVAVETVWHEVAARLAEVETELTRARQAGPAADEPLAMALAAVDADLDRTRRMLSTDPLELWQDNQVRMSELDRLHRQASAAASRAGLLAGTDPG